MTDKNLNRLLSIYANAHKYPNELGGRFNDGKYDPEHDKLKPAVITFKQTLNLFSKKNVDIESIRAKLKQNLHFYSSDELGLARIEAIVASIKDKETFENVKMIYAFILNYKKDLIDNEFISQDDYNKISEFFATITMMAKRTGLDDERILPEEVWEEISTER